MLRRLTHLLSASIVRYYFTQNTQEWRWATLDLAEFIPPPAWLRYCHSNSSICMLLFFVITTFKKKKKKRTRRFFFSFFFSRHPRNPPRLRALRRRPRSGPPTPGLSYPEFPPQTSSGWPAGCPTLAPSSPRSSAAQETAEKLRVCERLTCQAELEIIICYHDDNNERLQRRPVTVTSRGLRGRNETDTNRVFFFMC